MLLLDIDPGWFHRVFDKLLDPIGVTGAIGQTIFAGRMIVQWWVSEKQKRSVVPKVFWHMSLWGAVLTLVYAVGKEEPLLMVSQASGLVVYARNLVLLSNKHEGTSAPVA